MKPEIIQTHPFIDTYRSKGFQYYVIPKAMLRQGKLFNLSIDEVALYAVLKDRTSLSYKNRWLDENGHVYIYFSREEAAKLLGWSKKKTIAVFKRLNEAGLLKEAKPATSGIRKAYKLFLKQWIEPSLLHSPTALREGGFPYLSEWNIAGASDPYYILPKCLLEDDIYDGLSLRAIMLYVIALDTIHLSIANNRVDENGLVWCVLDTAEMTDILWCSDKSLYSGYKELEASGLIVRRRDNQTGYYRIYLRDYLPPPASPGALPPEEEECPATNAVQTNGAIYNGEMTNPVRTGAFKEGNAPGTSQECTRDRKNLHLLSEESAPRVGVNDTRWEKEVHPEGEKMSSDGRNNFHPNNLFYPSSPSSLNSISIAPDGTGAEASEEEREDIFKKYFVRRKFDENTKRMEYERQISASSLEEDIEICQTGLKRALMQFLLNRCLEIMVEDSLAPGSEIRLGSTVLRRCDLMVAYTSLTRYVMYAVLMKLADRCGDSNIRDLDAYIRKSLSSAYIDYESVAIYVQRDIMEKRRNYQIEQLEGQM